MTDANPEGKRAIRILTVCGISWILFALVLPWHASAQVPDVPIATQVDVYLGVLGFDRALENRVGDEFVIGIVYQDLNPGSLAATRAFERQSDEAKSVSGIPIRIAPHNLSNDLSEVQIWIEHEKPDIIWIAPLRGVAIKDLIDVIDRSNVATLASLAGYMSEGASIGVTLRRNRPKLLVNLEATKRAGMLLEARLLDLATIVRSD